jgi:hypothetical protein
VTWIPYLGGFLVSDEHGSQLTIHFEEHLPFSILGKIGGGGQSLDSQSFTLLNGNLEQMKEKS